MTARLCDSCDLWERLPRRYVCERCAVRIDALPAELRDAIRAAADAAEYGTPAAVKRGRDDRWPYVPIVRHSNGKTTQLRGLAYATPAEATNRAVTYLESIRDRTARGMTYPRNRALREQHGLPRELPQPINEK